MKLPSNCHVEIQPNTVQFTDGSLGDMCFTVTFRNDGEVLAVVLRVTVRICIRIRNGQLRHRVCFSQSFATRIEIEGKCLESIEVPAGEVVVFTACTDVGEKVEDADAIELDVEIHEQHGGQEFVRTITTPLKEWVSGPQHS